eukprot:CAMPEP_0197033596 /NCGR_PEP_ID=MMETSP1384-20130603/11972_1 /TAXON_ID=29189 /ORGANISM="Ammonia sp." /LENGTH=410 /DNA_ID=CAMNT_0042463433 /DNA_START=24 /DNA_END=1256 /DNA_ORIENTATION=-
MQTALQLLEELQNKVSSACNDDAKIEEISYDNKDGFDNYLLRAMHSENGDSSSMILSPFSILTAMTLCMLGAANKTLKQMLEVMYPCSAHKPLSFETTSKLTADIVELGKYYNDTYCGTKDHALVRVANKIWINKTYKILDKYVQASKVDSIGSFDRLQAAQAAAQINAWCAKNTNNLITELVNAGIMANAQLVIANAIYFKGKFVTPFDKNKTMSNTPFYSDKTRKQEVAKVDMMENEAVLSYVTKVNDIYDVVTLPYKCDKQLSLILAINNHCDAQSVPLFTTEDILNMHYSWKKEKIQLFVPKFEFQSAMTLNSVLQRMGIRDAFDEKKADFSNMTPAKDLFISSVIHKAVIKVDEEGTEAAAVTGVIMSNCAFMPSPILRFDHPFQFFVYDNVKKVALFTGVFMGK